MTIGWLSFGYCAKMCLMGEAEKETEKETLRVLLDEQLRQDLARAREVTGIRSNSDLVRYALRQVARRAREEFPTPDLGKL
jgi:hypothetical protein